MTRSAAVEKTSKYMNVKIDLKVREVAKAAASLIGEEYYEFVEKCIRERLFRLKDAGKLPIDLKEAGIERSAA